MLNTPLGMLFFHRNIDLENPLGNGLKIYTYNTLKEINRPTFVYVYAVCEYNKFTYNPIDARVYYEGPCYLKDVVNRQKWEF